MGFLLAPITGTLNRVLLDDLSISVMVIGLLRNAFAADARAFAANSARPWRARLPWGPLRTND